MTDNRENAMEDIPDFEDLFDECGEVIASELKDVIVGNKDFEKCEVLLDFDYENKQGKKFDENEFFQAVRGKDNISIIIITPPSKATKTKGSMIATFMERMFPTTKVSGPIECDCVEVTEIFNDGEKDYSFHEIEDKGFVYSSSPGTIVTLPGAFKLGYGRLDFIPRGVLAQEKSRQSEFVRKVVIVQWQ